MTRVAWIGVVGLLAASILLVFVSPALNAPETALRSQQHATRVLLALGAVLSAVLPLLIALIFTSPAREFAPVPLSVSLVDFTCTRRC